MRKTCALGLAFLLVFASLSPAYAAAAASPRAGEVPVPGIALVPASNIPLETPGLGDMLPVGLDADAIVLGSGPGASVAVLRLALAGKKVVVLERGQEYQNQPYPMGLGSFWAPKQGLYGNNELAPIGPVVSWVGSGVGGGTHVWAKVMLRAKEAALSLLPSAIRPEALNDVYYPLVESMMGVETYPDRPPYSDAPNARWMREMGELAASRVEGARSFPLPLAVHFAQPGERPGGDFVNEHGVLRRTLDPREHVFLGGNWRTSPTADSTYLAAALKTGNVTILPLHEADKIEVLPDGRAGEAYRVSAQVHPSGASVSFTAPMLFLGAGAVGTTKLLLRNSFIHKTLTRLSSLVGSGFGINGDRVSLAFRPHAGDGTKEPFISSAVLFPSHGKRSEVLLMDAAYPPLGLASALFVLDFLGLGTPYRRQRLAAFFKPLGKLLARWQPLGLFGMHSGGEAGKLVLDGDGRLRAELDFKAHAAADRVFDERMAALTEPEPGQGFLTRWMNRFYRFLAGFAYRRAPVLAPHNLGGVPLGDTPERGAADPQGKLFGYRNIYAVDGSVLPPAIGRNPTETLMALAERAMTHALWEDNKRTIRELAGKILAAPRSGKISARVHNRAESIRRQLRSRQASRLPLTPEGRLLNLLLDRIQETAALADFTPEFLLRYAARLDGWLEGLAASDLEAAAAQSPALEAGPAEAYALSEQELKQREETARAAGEIWAKMPLRRRIRAVRKFWKLLLSRRSEIVETVHAETGKPLAEIEQMEILAAEGVVRYLTGAGYRVLKDRSAPLPWYMRVKRARIHNVPLGLIGLITPWNFPFLIPVGDMAAALIAGNAVWLKPSEWTPKTALLLERIFVESGLFPKGLFQVLLGDGRLGKRVVEQADKVLFTGSERAGKSVYETAARNMRHPPVLELGGNHAMIVLADAPFERAVQGAVMGAFANAGQACIGVERIFVDRIIYGRFTRAVVDRVRQLRQGLGPGYDLDVGRMIFPGQLATIKRHLADAKAKGARILGKGVVDEERLVVAPTVVLDASEDMLIMREETFGPVLAIMPVDDPEEALKFAASGKDGLSGSIWTRDSRRASDMSRRFPVGMVGINEVLSHYPTASMPFGGFKPASGLGRRHGEEGLRMLTQPQSVIHHPAWLNIPELWWFPYSRLKARLLYWFSRL